ncbi:MAG: ribbon-helix-helix domain-containing protein [Chloroflexi bacterium]|nr:ribbon-helix-helix domain-containing protein [Chloroflexota bacterium]
MNIAITLPPSMLREIEQLAERRGKTVSDLLAEAVRYYLIQVELQELERYGQEQAEKLGLDPADVEWLIHEYRQEQRQRQSG